METLFSPTSVLSAFIAGILFFLVAPHLALISRSAALAVRLAAAALVIDLAVILLSRFVVELELPVDPFLLSAALTGLAFWGCLAWAVLAVVDSAPKRELR